MSNEKKSSKKPIIFLAVAAIIATIGGIYFYINAGYETTDNAQIDADIVPIRTSVSAYVQDVRFTDNEFVHKGDTLVLMNDVEFRAKLQQAQAALENAQANLLAVQSNASATVLNADAAIMTSESAEQSIEIAKARLVKIQEDYNRIKNMFGSKAATKAEMDAIEAELAVAKAQYAASGNQFKASNAQSKGVRSQSEGQKAMVNLAQALVRQREAELNLAQTLLSYTVILAPCDGKVAKRSIEVGQFVAVGSPICTLVDNTNLWISANFKETQMEGIHLGQNVEVKVDAYPPLNLKGKVEAFVGATGANFALLPPDNATGNFVKIVQRVPVRIRLQELSAQQRELLLPGLSAFVSVQVR
jgi:membrane fusion protein (multidrug efflux system)